MGPIRIGLIVVGVSAIMAGTFFFWPVEPPPAPPPVAKADPPAASPVAAPPSGPRYVVPTDPAPATPPQPLPELNDSDPVVGTALTSLLGRESTGQFIVLESLVRHVVVTIDNLPRSHFARELSPINPPAGTFRAIGKEESLVIDPDNAARYERYVKFAEALDAKKIVALYMRFYPLFQKAYQDLGFPEGYFNDRLVEVIDHLLAAPELQAPVRLTVPHVLHEFADPELEARSAGQKMMMRMGAANEARLKVRLRELRREVVAQSRTR
jgi:Protein of unknown function (DUF3014)